MKKALTFISASITAFVLSVTPAMAATIEPAVIIGGIKTAASEAYDASVIARMAGRSGSATQTGAKGIAFEIMASDKKNLFQAFKNELKTIQTKNPTATQVDLVTISKDGNKVVERLQLKDIQSDSGINSLIKRVKNGDYRQAQLLGTDETAELYNAKAAAEGISKTMKKSGISTKSTQRIANKALHNMPTAASAVENIAATSGSFAAVGAVIHLAESVVDGDDAVDTISNTLVGGAKGAISGAAGGAAGTAATAVLTAAEISNPVAWVLIPVTAVSAAVLTDISLEQLAETTKDRLSVSLHAAQDFTEKKVEYIAVAINESGIKEKSAEIAKSAKNTAIASAKNTSTAISNGLSIVTGKK